MTRQRKNSPPTRPGTAPSVDCPVCRVPRGMRCRGRRGQIVDYHTPRREAAQALYAEAEAWVAASAAATLTEGITTS